MTSPRLRNRILLAALVLAASAVAWFAYDLFHVPDLRQVNGPRLLSECLCLMAAHRQTGAARGNLAACPEIQKLSPLGIEIDDNRVLISLRGRSGLCCYRVPAMGEWVLETAGDLVSQRLAAMPDPNVLSPPATAPSR